ncbi:hypothetical protein B0H11DRAFT_1956824 [Mycena galericulata]|nr:hypothetical protein B0H11DRAFT_1956824 [Mycena galericulata]
MWRSFCLLALPSFHAGLRGAHIVGGMLVGGPRRRRHSICVPSTCFLLALGALSCRSCLVLFRAGASCVAACRRSSPVRRSSAARAWVLPVDV